MLHTIMYKKIIVPKIPPGGAGSIVSSRSMPHSSSFPGRHSLVLVLLVLVGLMCFCVSCNHYVLGIGRY